jgi:general secretion pathway protein I
MPMFTPGLRHGLKRKLERTRGFTLHRRLLAGWSADDELAQLRLTHTWPDIGSRTFDCSQGNLKLICTDSVSTTPNPIFRRVEVIVESPGISGNLAQMVMVVANETNRSL